MTGIYESIEWYLFWFVNPVRSAFFVHIIPPTQTYQKTPGNVLDCPEIGGQEKHHKYKTSDEGVAKPTAKDVNHQSHSTKKQMEKRDVRMSKKVEKSI